MDPKWAEPQEETAATLSSFVTPESETSAACVTDAVSHNLNDREGEFQRAVPYDHLIITSL